MRSRCPAGLVCLVLGLAGCAQDGRDGFAFRNPFRTDRALDPTKGPAASTLAATRVNAVGSAILAKNPDALGVKPVFFAMGVSEVEISHDKSGIVTLSEGLIERCPTDTDLAAVICHELGKLAAETAAGRAADHDPSGPRLTRDVIGGSYEPDLTRLVEDAKYDRRNRSSRTARPDARALGQSLFVAAGHPADDYARMTQLHHEAEDNADRRASELRR